MDDIAIHAEPEFEAVDSTLAFEDLRVGMRATFAAMELPPDALPPARTIEWKAALLANQARNAEPAFAAIADGSLGDPGLRALARYVVDQLRAKRDDAEPPALLAHLMASEVAMSRGQRELLLGLINQTCADAELVLDDRETRRFLAHAVPDDEPGLQR